MERRRYPKSYYKYRESHPAVPVRVSKELKAALDAYRGGLSYAKAIRRLLEEKTDFLKEKAQVEALRKQAAASGYKDGFEKGYREAKVIERLTVTCSRCGKPLTLTSRNRAWWENNIRPILLEAFAKWHHTKCPQESEAEAYLS